MAAIEGWKGSGSQPSGGVVQGTEDQLETLALSCLPPFRASPLSLLSFHRLLRFGIGIPFFLFPFFPFFFLPRVAPAMGGNQAAPSPTNREPEPQVTPLECAGRGRSPSSSTSSSGRSSSLAPSSCPLPLHHQASRFLHLSSRPSLLVAPTPSPFRPSFLLLLLIFPPLTTFSCSVHRV